VGSQTDGEATDAALAGAPTDGVSPTSIPPDDSRGKPRTTKDEGRRLKAEFQQSNAICIRSSFILLPLSFQVVPLASAGATPLLEPSRRCVILVGRSREVE